MQFNHKAYIKLVYCRRSKENLWDRTIFSIDPEVQRCMATELSVFNGKTTDLTFEEMSRQRSLIIKALLNDLSRKQTAYIGPNAPEHLKFSARLDGGPCMEEFSPDSVQWIKEVEDRLDKSSYHVSHEAANPHREPTPA